MNETTARWEDLHLFLSVAREGGLSAAARVTGRSAATLGRRMLSLERSMGRELFVRHGRGYELTGEGRDLLTELTEVEARITRLAVTHGSGEKRLVKISAGSWTTLLLLDNLDGMTGTPADLRLRFVAAETSLNITRREIAIGIRNARPTDPGLAGRSLSRVEFAPYARAGAPDRWIKVMTDTPSARWLDRMTGTDAICEVTAPRNSLDLALAGKGIALLPTFIGDRQTALDRVGSTIAELTYERWVVTHQDDRHLPEVRRAIDRLARVLGER